MADLQSIIKIIFDGDDRTSDIARGVSKSISDLGQVATDIAEPFAGLANKILIADAAITGIATVIAVKAVGAANEFSSSIADLNRFLSEGEGDAQQYKQQFDDLSIKYGTNVNEIIQSTSDWKAANLDIKTSLDLTRIALDYSIAGQISAGEATDTLKKIVSGMSVENDKVVESSKRFGDIMNYIGDSAKTNFKQVADGVALIAPNIKQSGASFEQATAIIAVMNEVLQSGSSSGAAFNVIMGQMAKPTKDAQIELEKFGVTVDKNGINQETFYGTLSKIAAKWPELTAEQQRVAAATLVSSENTKAFIPILENWGKVGVLSSESVGKGMDSMSKEVKRALDTSEAAFKSFNASLDLLFITLGTQISPGVVSVVKSLTSLDKALKDVSEGANNPFKPLSDSLNGVLSNFSTVIDSVTKNLPAALNNVDFSGLISSFDGLFGELDTLFKKFFGDIDITTVEGLSDALQKIIDTGSLLVTTTQGIVKAFEPFDEAAGRAVENFIALDKGSQLDFGQFIGSAKLLVDAGFQVGGALLAISKSGQDMGRALDIVFGSIKVSVNILQVTFDAVRLGLLKIQESALESGKSINEFFSKFALTDEGRENSKKAVIEYQKSLDALRVTMDGVSANIERNVHEWQDGYDQQMGRSKKATDEYSESADNAGKRLKGFTSESLSAALGIKDVDKAVTDTSESLVGLKDITIPKIEFLSKTDAAEAAGQIKKVGEESQILVPKLVTVRDENGKVIKSYTEMTNVIPGVTGGLSILGSGIDKAKDKTKDAAKESDNFRIKMEEIASNERIKNIEAFVSLNVADLEAQTKQVEAAFSSINETISGTGDLLGSLFGSLSSADTYTKLQITEQIDLENKRREAALELQKQLTQATIEKIQAETRRIERGDALITVEAAGLEPHLEAIWFQIMKYIRARVNSDAEQFLLGST